MTRVGVISLATIVAIILGAAYFSRAGLPLRPLPVAGLVGAVDDAAIDPGRRERFATDQAQRIIPFQMLYPASAKGRAAIYVPEAEVVIDGIGRNQGRVLATGLRRIERLRAPWTEGAAPAGTSPMPVVLYLPGLTGYMQMSSFQTSALAADGFVVVSLNQPGSVAAARLPNGKTIPGMSRESGMRAIQPVYRDMGRDPGIVSYLAADVPAVIARLRVLNADPRHRLYGRMDLTKVGVMGVSLGALVTAEACHTDPTIAACLMMDAPVPRQVARSGLKQAALWLSRPPVDQRAEREAVGGWPEDEIAAQAQSIAQAVSRSPQGRVQLLHGMYHIDFTDIPAIQPLIGEVGLAGPSGSTNAHAVINHLTLQFFRRLRTVRSAAAPDGAL